MFFPEDWFMRSTLVFSPITPTPWHRVARRAGLALGLVALVVLVGCGPPSNPLGDATVSGKVLVGGKAPVGGTTIKFIGPDAKEATGAVDGTGAYTVNHAPIGQCKVVVKGGAGATAKDIGKSEMPGMPGSGGVTVPKKYEQPGDLTFNVEKGKNTKDFDLAP
jgi:hypothetical protein